MRVQDMDWNDVRARNEHKKRKHGPSPNPDSMRQRLFVAREASKKRKEEYDASTSGCTWESSTRGGQRRCEGDVCCANWQCSTQYGPLVVAKLRKYFSTLDKQGRREFLAARSPVRGVDSSRPIQGQRAYEACLESPQALEEKLSRQGVVGVQLGAVDPEQVQPVCKRWLTFATADNNDTTYKHRRRVELGPEMTMEHLDLSIPLPARKPPEKGREATGATMVVKWLHEQAEMSCVMPNCEQIVLPWRTKAAAHANYIKDMEERLGVEWAGKTVAVGVQSKKKNASSFRYGNYLLGKVGSLPICNQLVSRAHFCRTWTECLALRDVVVRRWMPFAKCTQCSTFRDLEVSRKKLSRPERDKAHEVQRKHLADIKLERRHYHSNRLRAILDPDKYLSLIIDGADQSNHMLPHFSNRSHLSDEAVKQHLYNYGVIAHGRKAYSFLLPGHVMQGHDVTIEVLWRVMNDVFADEGKLPPVLLLQLDNTTKQNKGRFLFAFLALLVHHNVYDKVLVSFLPVGHTHEDIDQMFSRFAQYLRTHHARSRPEMAECIRRAYIYNDKSAQVHILQTVAAMSDFLLEGTGIELPECMSHRHFRIRRDAAGRTIIQGRSSPIASYVTEPWLGLEGNSSFHDIFPRMTPNLCAAMDRGLVPVARRPSKPTKAKLIEKMRASLKRLRNGMGALFPDAHYQDCIGHNESIRGSNG